MLRQRLLCDTLLFQTELQRLQNLNVELSTALSASKRSLQLAEDKEKKARQQQQLQQQQNPNNVELVQVGGGHSAALSLKR